MSSASNYNQLFKLIEKKIKESMEDELLEDSVNTLKMEIKTEVYDTYTPVIYDRRYEKGGLVDDDNIKTKVTGNTLTIQSDRRDEEKPSRNVGYIVETGEGYNYDVPAFLEEGRPFTETTREKLRSGVAVKSLKKGLINRGLQVEE